VIATILASLPFVALAVTSPQHKPSVPHAKAKTAAGVASMGIPAPCATAIAIDPGMSPLVNPCLPTATPDPNPTATPTPFGTPSPTPTPFGFSTPTPTPFETPTPTPFGTPSPTPTPFGTPSPTPTPFGTPSPTPTPVPTATPTATPSPTPTPAPRDPVIKMDVNNTDAVNDDVVRLKFKNLNMTNDQVFTTLVNISATNNTDTDTTNDLLLDVQVQLICPSGRVEFSTNASGSPKTATLNLTLPKSGAIVSFYIVGINKSISIGDAVINVMRPPKINIPPKSYGSKNATVFWFDQAEMDPRVRIEGQYKLLAGQVITIIGSLTDHTVDPIAKVKLMPQGLDTTIPQISRLKLSYLQTVRASVNSIGEEYTENGINWLSTASTGTSITVPLSYSNTLNKSCELVDSDQPYYPLYDAGVSLLSIGYTEMTSTDTPQIGIEPVISDVTHGGVLIGHVTYNYKLGTAKKATNFQTVAVINDIQATTSMVKRQWLKEGEWSLNILEGRDDSPILVSKNIALTKTPKETGTTATIFMNNAAVNFTLTPSTETKTYTK
jgi:hypothetical protein